MPRIFNKQKNTQSGRDNAVARSGARIKLACKDVAAIVMSCASTRSRRAWVVNTGVGAIDSPKPADDSSSSGGYAYASSVAREADLRSTIAAARLVRCDCGTQMCEYTLSSGEEISQAVAWARSRCT